MGNQDTVSTLAGGGAAAALLASVKWELVPHGEAVKIGVAFLLMVVGYFMYRKAA
jgi:hypothetical protein